jgi:very-short-patch-repair endonuclease
VVVPADVARRRAGIKLLRRADLGPSNRRERERIPVTDVASTLIDLATAVGDERLEAAINAADRHGFTDPERLRAAPELLSPRPGLARLRKLLDREAFAPTDSYLERRFLTLIRGAGIPSPETQAQVNGFRVDFYWPELGLVVETDGLRYHRTAAQQGRDLRRDQAHSAAGLETLRFSAAQVRDEPRRVLATIRRVVARLKSSD